MFGKITEINGNSCIVENISHVTHSELMNCHVVFPESDRLVVGEIIKIGEEKITILLVGEIRSNRFFPGVVKKPSTTPRIINVNELELIIGKQTKDIPTLGHSTIYKNYDVKLPIDSMFGNHLAIIGNTGSGKSCGVTRILQNLFTECTNKPKNSHFVIFDAYGEYTHAFDGLDVNTKVYTAVKESALDLGLILPPNFLEVDDLAILLGVTETDQLPVLEKTLKLVYIFTSSDEKVIEYKNDIIAKCLLDILTSGKSGSQMRDQIIAVLTHYKTDSLNLETIVHTPGYDRTLKQCLLIDDRGKINAMELITKFLSEFTKLNLNDIIIDKNYTYSLNDLYYALEFALMSEGTINSTLSYSKNNILKNRLQTIINSKYKSIFEVNEYVTKEDYISKFFTKNEENAPLIIINLSTVDDRFAKILTKLFTKLFFTYTITLNKRASFPVNIILEEAHRYVQNDSDINIIGYNIFDRITKEGRKYGTLLTFITQRPSELSSTALSQCSNFVIFRIFHPKDFEIVKSISTNVDSENLEKLKTLNSGTSLVFGTGFKIPLLVSFDLPSPMPTSTNVMLSQIWYQ
jgi:DNA helicase HerA-like ATPase